MKTKLFSPLLTAANNIVKTRRPLTKRAKEYDAFINWLDTSNKDVKKIKLPKVKKVEDLEFSIGMDGGGGNGGLFGSLLSALGVGAAGGFGLRSLIKKFGKGKPAITATKGSKNIFSGISKIGQKTKPTGVKAANNIVNFNRQPSKIEDVGSAKAPKGKIGKIGRIGGGLLSVGLTAADFMGRKGEGQSNLQAGVGAGGGLAGGLAGAWAGGQAGAAVGAGIGALFGGVGAAPGAVIGGIIGSLAGGFGGGQLGGNLADKLTGADKMDQRLKAQEKIQREAASASNVTFVSITDKFDKVVSKFEKIAGGMGAASGKQSPKQQEIQQDQGKPIEKNEKLEPESGSKQTFDTGDFSQSSGVVKDRPWNSGIKLTTLKTKSGASYQVATALAPRFKGFVDELENSGYKINSIGGWRKAGSGGGSGPADPDYDENRYFHPYGAAIDINPSDNPYSPSGSTFKTNLPKNISEIAHKYGLGWGGDWRSSKDTMHFSAGSREGGSGFDLKSLFGTGNQKPSAKKGAKETADIRGSTPDTKQQSIEDFAKQTMGKGADRILKDPKLKSQLSGGKQGTDPEIKQLQKNYNVYVKGIRERRQAQIAPGQTPQVPGAITTPLQEQTPGSAILLGQSQPAGQPSMVPVPIPMGGGGGGGGGVAVVSLSEGQILNSLWKTMLLTNLSST